MLNDESNSGRLWPSPPPSIPLQVRVPQSSPFWTYALLLVNLLAFFSAWLVGRDLVLMLGAKVNRAIVAGEVWRLGTAMFLHVDILHIGFNSYALLIFGPQVEQLYGRFRFLLMYLLSGVAGSALSFLLSPYPSVGASGAIFGLIGVMGAYLYQYRNRLVAGRSRLANLLAVAVYNLIYGFVAPAVDNWGHVGGLLAGLALGWFLVPRYRLIWATPAEPPRMVDRGPSHHWLIGIALVVLGIGLAVVGGFLRWG